MNKFIESLLIGLAAGAVSQFVCELIEKYRTKKLIDSTASYLKGHEFKRPKR